MVEQLYVWSTTEKIFLEGPIIFNGSAEEKDEVAKSLAKGRTGVVVGTLEVVLRKISLKDRMLVGGLLKAR